ncbi:MAG: hypothetical protein MI799_19815 [Desulfobacterales bacterium]|nr:hypothetical protein [Desulfobacterales bacterium]
MTTQSPKTGKATPEPVFCFRTNSNFPGQVQAYAAQPHVQGLKIPFTILDRAAFVQHAVYSVAWMEGFKLEKQS